MNQYIITEELLRNYRRGTSTFEDIEDFAHHHPYAPQAELDIKLAKKYRSILNDCREHIEETRRKYTIAPKDCKGCSVYDLCEELRQEGKP